MAAPHRPPADGGSTGAALSGSLAPGATTGPLDRCLVRVKTLKRSFVVNGKSRCCEPVRHRLAGSPDEQALAARVHELMRRQPQVMMYAADRAITMTFDRIIGRLASRHARREACRRAKGAGRATPIFSARQETAGVVAYVTTKSGHNPYQGDDGRHMLSQRLNPDATPVSSQESRNLTDGWMARAAARAENFTIFMEPLPKPPSARPAQPGVPVCPRPRTMRRRRCCRRSARRSPPCRCRWPRRSRRSTKPRSRKRKSQSAHPGGSGGRSPTRPGGSRCGRPAAPVVEVEEPVAPASPVPAPVRSGGRSPARPGRATRGAANPARPGSRRPRRPAPVRPIEIYAQYAQWPADG